MSVVSSVTSSCRRRAASYDIANINRERTDVPCITAKSACPLLLRWNPRQPPVTADQRCIARRSAITSTPLHPAGRIGCAEPLLDEVIEEQSNDRQSEQNRGVREASTRVQMHHLGLTRICSAEQVADVCCHVRARRLFWPDTLPTEETQEIFKGPTVCLNRVLRKLAICLRSQPGPRHRRSGDGRYCSHRIRL